MGFVRIFFVSWGVVWVLYFWDGWHSAFWLSRTKISLTSNFLPYFFTIHIFKELSMSESYSALPPVVCVPNSSIVQSVSHLPDCSVWQPFEYIQMASCSSLIWHILEEYLSGSSDAPSLSWTLSFEHTPGWSCLSLIWPLNWTQSTYSFNRIEYWCGRYCTMCRDAAVNKIRISLPSKSFHSDEGGRH